MSEDPMIVAARILESVLVMIPCLILAAVICSAAFGWPNV